MKNFKKKYQKFPVKELANDITKFPLVSICVLTYQHANYINKCLEGILKQKTNFPIEIIIGEDESQDGTREICIKYAKKYPDKIRLFLHSRKNNIKIAGKSTGRFTFVYNIYNARGKYIALLDGDDYWINPNKLQKQVDCFESNPDCSICFNPSFIINEKNKKLPYIWGPPFIKKHYTIEHLILYGNFIPTSSVMFRNDLFKTFPGWFYEIITGDWPLNIINARYGKICFIDDYMSIWRKHPGGLYSSAGKIKKLQIETQALNVFEKNLNKRYKKLIKNKIARNLFQMKLDYNKKINTKKAKNYAFSSLFCCIKYKKLRISSIKVLAGLLFPSFYKILKKTKIKLIKKGKIFAKK